LVCVRCSYVFYENPAVGVAAIVLNEDRQILLGRRGAALADITPQTPGVRRKKQTNSLTMPATGDEQPASIHKRLWCIPCGYVEYDEDVYQAVIREFKEETNLDIVLEGVFTVQSNFHNPELHTVGIWFMAKATGGELRAGDDLDQLAYCNLTDPPPLAFPTDKIVLDMLAKTFQAPPPNLPLQGGGKGGGKGTEAQREMKQPCCRGVLQYAPTKENENPGIFR